MNRCRRILAAALAAVMLLALTACGQSADTNNSAEQTVVRIGTPATGDHGARMLEAARVALLGRRGRITGVTVGGHDAWCI